MELKLKKKFDKFTCVLLLRFLSFVLKKSNMKVIEITATLVIKNRKIFTISKNPITNSTTCIGKERTGLSHCKNNCKFNVTESMKVNKLVQ